MNKIINRPLTRMTIEASVISGETAPLMLRIHLLSIAQAACILLHGTNEYGAFPLPLKFSLSKENTSARYAVLFFGVNLIKQRATFSNFDEIYLTLNNRQRPTGALLRRGRRLASLSAPGGIQFFATTQEGMHAMRCAGGH